MHKLELCGARRIQSPIATLHADMEIVQLFGERTVWKLDEGKENEVPFEGSDPELDDGENSARCRPFAPRGPRSWTMQLGWPM